MNVELYIEFYNNNLLIEEFNVYVCKIIIENGRYIESALKIQII